MTRAAREAFEPYRFQTRNINEGENKAHTREGAQALGFRGSIVGGAIVYGQMIRPLKTETDWLAIRFGPALRAVDDRMTFDARVLDMESAAVAHVAYANGVPFIAVRSLADLAGGGEGANQMEVFLDLAGANAAAVVTALLAAMRE